MVTIKDTLKLFGISIVICCAAFVCTLFINYRIDLVNAKDTISGEQAMKMYDAQLSTSTVVLRFMPCADLDSYADYLY